MLKTILSSALIMFSAALFGNPSDTISKPWKSQVIEVRHLNDSTDVSYIDNSSIFTERWDKLAQPLFWKTVMTLSPDSCLINIAETRTVVKKMSIADWNRLSDDEKEYFRDSIRTAHGLTEEDKIYMTSGKSDFYAFEKVLPSVAKGVEVFEKEGVDPWYAQAILMIESPGKLAKSSVGAYGPFQLMPSVARTHGLKVNKYVDERKDFVRSAQGASSLISKTCLPEARRILTEQGIAFREHDLWFRLFVLHIYHAGAYNVAGVIKKIDPLEGGLPLITEMWQTEAGQFRNASQNYTQLALAALLIFDELIWEKCDYLVADN